MQKLSFNTRRVIVGFAMVPMLVWVLNHYAGLRWFAKYDEIIKVTSFLLLLIAVVFIGPSVEELRERRAKRIRDSGLDE